jgi:hypothetical protein
MTSVRAEGLARKTDLIEAAIEQLYGAGVTLDDLKDYFRNLSWRKIDPDKALKDDCWIVSRGQGSADTE